MAMPAHLDLIVEGLIFLTIVAVTWILSREIERALDQRRRLGEQGGPASNAALPLLQGKGINNEFFQWVQSSTSISEPAERQRLRGELLLAGFESPTAPVWYVIARFLLAIGLPLLFLLSQVLLAKTLGGAGFIFGVLALAGVGFLGPSF